MVNFEDGTLVSGAYVEINGVQYPVHMPQYSGNTPASAENLNKMQTDLKTELNTVQTNMEEEISKQEEEDFMNKVTFNESAVTNHCEFIKKGNMVFIVYQGESKVHVANDVLFTIPERL